MLRYACVLCIVSIVCMYLCMYCLHIYVYACMYGIPLYARMCACIVCILRLHVLYDNHALYSCMYMYACTVCIYVCIEHVCVIVYVCVYACMHAFYTMHCMYAFIHSFIHSGHFYSAPSSPLLLRGAPDYSTDTVSEFHAEAHRQL